MTANHAAAAFAHACAGPLADALGNTTQQCYDIEGYSCRIVYPDDAEAWFFRNQAKHVTRHVSSDGAIESFA